VANKKPKKEEEKEEKGRKEIDMLNGIIDMRNVDNPISVSSGHVFIDLRRGGEEEEKEKEEERKFNLRVNCKLLTQKERERERDGGGKAT